MLHPVKRTMIMNTKTRLFLIGGIIVIVLVALILRNRAAMNATSEGSSIATAYSVSVVAAARQSLDDKITLVGTVIGAFARRSTSTLRSATTNQPGPFSLKWTAS